tara:strand:- start:201 stop:1184 length:984 start_codon:yes stop_codon:yes gene_type:complete
MELTAQTAARFAQAALGHVAREYPHKLDHVMDGDADVRPPRELHPCFFGSFDWHSCVHGWWTLLTLRRLHPELPESARIGELAESTFTPEKLAAELSYAERPSARGFERPYGWGWLLALHHEAARHDEEWVARMEPLARHFADRFKAYLGVLTYPVFVGTHYNTAFALTLARAWAEDRDPELVAIIDAWSRSAFLQHSAYAGWEPGGDEFLSPVLSAALLMYRVLPPPAFAPWFAALVLENGWLAALEPATVSDRTDGKIAHLDGLNLSRAWALREIVHALSHAEDREMLHSKAAAHLDAALPHVTGDYMGEHWLASFALLALLAGE